MAAPGRRSGSEFAIYLRSAADLRLAIGWAERDRRYEEARGGRIVYLYDANIVRLFLNPTAEARHLAMLGEDASAAHLSVTALITAELLFSRGLPGQHGRPPILAPSHAADVGDMLAAIHRRVGDVVRTADAQSGTAPASSLLRLVQAARAGTLDVDEVVSRLGHEVARVARTLFADPTYEARQFRRLVDDDLLRPLALLPEATREVMEPDDRIVGVWERLIAQVRWNPTPTDRSGAARRRLIRRDAETMVQLLSLNEPAPNAIPPTKYVLVTTDRAMRRAYDRWFWAQDADPDAYAVRHPSQFVPLLNSGRTEAGADGPDPVAQVTKALDGLLDFVGGKDWERTRALSAFALGRDGGGAWEEGREASRADARSNPRPSLDQVRKRWYGAGRAAAVLNASILDQRMLGEFGEVAGLLRDDVDVRIGVMERLDRSLRDLEVGHAKLVLGGLLGTMVAPPDDVVAVAAGTGPTEMRLLVRRPFEADAQATTAILERRGMVDLRDLANSSLQDIGRPPHAHDGMVLFFASCAAAEVGRWPMALRCCRRAIDAVHRDAGSRSRSEGRSGNGLGHAFNLHELHYVEAVAFRRAASDGETYAEVRGRLADSERHFRMLGDHFGLARTLSEEAALRVSAAFLARERRLEGLPSPMMFGKGMLEAAEKVVEASALATRIASWRIASEAATTANRILIHDVASDPPRLPLAPSGLAALRTASLAKAPGSDGTPERIEAEFESELLQHMTHGGGDLGRGRSQAARDLLERARRLHASDPVTRAVIEMATRRLEAEVDASPDRPL